MRDSGTKKRVRVLKHLVNVCIAVLSVGLMTSPISAAVDTSEGASKVIGSEGSVKATKVAIDVALKMSKSKPAITVATGIVCLACIPVAGVAASPGLCIACGILIAKTLG